MGVALQAGLSTPNLFGQKKTKEDLLRQFALLGSATIPNAISVLQ